MPITKGHNYATVAADLDRMVPIWLGGTGRTGENLNRFYTAIEPNVSNTIQHSWS